MNDTRYLLEEKEVTQYSSFFKSFGPDQDQVADRETLESLAALMGVSLVEIENRVRESQRLSRVAWKPNQKLKKAQQAGPITGYDLIVEFDGKQLFWQVGGEQFLVNVGGRPCFEPTLKDALHRLTCD